MYLVLQYRSARARVALVPLCKGPKPRGSDAGDPGAAEAVKASLGEERSTIGYFEMQRETIST